MSKLVNAIAGRMSLREPQKESLEILERIVESISLSKEPDLQAALSAIHDLYPSVTDFEREFPSVCFSLATGVGKTRLMGAFITYLYLTNRSRHFFVLAPNLTIYDKLISDFSPESSKYVFKGISEFATHRPIIITGDNYEDGQGVRLEHVPAKSPASLRKFDTGEVFVQQRLFSSDENVFINIFNVSKIDTKSRKGGDSRIKTPRECIGESYFDYLAGLPDLVLLMDEAHRYRAAAGARAINELKPILGLELTATPKSAGAKSQEFKNVIYSYPLSTAMKDGFVKEPAVATRKDFRPEDYTSEGLEEIKLEDGAVHHEHVKVELEVYSLQTGKALVHPFMLVVAQDVTHAANLRKYLESDQFREGRYKDKVIEVHSNLTGQESDEATQRLVSLEQDAKTEIVIHVNKLKEGWDVNNLYTIVPLRAFAAEILTEQTIGRGLRLPYGQRTGIESLDRLTIVAHDRFQDVIDQANRPDSIIKKTVTIGEGGDITTEKTKALTVPSILESLLSGNDPTGTAFTSSSAAILDTPQKREVANVVLDVVKQFERLGSSERLKDPEIKLQIEERVKEMLTPAQLQIEGVIEPPDITAIVDVVTKTIAELTIDIPKISVIATSEVTFGFNDFDLSNLSSITYKPVSEDILIQELRTSERSFLLTENLFTKEERLEDYIVRALIDKPEVDYDKHSDLLYKLAEQMITRISSYEGVRENIENILLYHQKSITNFIFQQLLEHCWETPTDYEVRVSKGFSVLRPNSYNVYSREEARDFRNLVSDKGNIKRMLFTGFKRCCYPIQKFDSDTERRFAIILENDDDVVKWMKPAVGHFQIEWKSGVPYQPDFVVETKTEKLICEPKSAAEIDSDEVRLKAKAAIRWCKHASEHAKVHGGKPWSYLLIPHTEVKDNRSVEGLKASFLAAH